MTAEKCAAVFLTADATKKAETLDAAFPNCVCEPWALTSEGGEGIDNGEVLARLLTTPDAYDEDAEALLTSKLTQIYAMGMSVVRQGASSEEINATIAELLTGGAEQRRLFGAIVMRAAHLRAYADEDELGRWFGVYATEDRGKRHHGDILGTKVSKGKQQRRRHRLAADMLPLVVRAEDPDDLITSLRAAGI